MRCLKNSTEELLRESKELTPTTELNKEEPNRETSTTSTTLSGGFTDGVQQQEQTCPQSLQLTL